MFTDPSLQADWASKRYVWVAHGTNVFQLGQIQREFDGEEEIDVYQLCNAVEIRQD